MCLCVYVSTFAHVQLLSRIAAAATAEELRKVHAEIEAALGIHELADEDVPASGLTPNVSELHVSGGGRHV